MPHFADDPAAEDPERLRKLRAMLRAMLRGPGARPRRLPTLGERFGVLPEGAVEPAGTRAEPARAVPRSDRR